MRLGDGRMGERRDRRLSLAREIHARRVAPHKNSAISIYHKGLRRMPSLAVWVATVTQIRTLVPDKEHIVAITQTNCSSTSSYTTQLRNGVLDVFIKTN